jgi:hypothetical protein
VILFLLIPSMGLMIALAPWLLGIFARLMPKTPPA